MQTRFFEATASIAAILAGLMLASAASAHDDRRGHHVFHHSGLRHLREIAVPQRAAPARTIDIVLHEGGSRDFGSYSGAADVYHADGGTYALGSGGGWYQPMPPALPRPTVKIIDVKSGGGACAYEHGVCVIRP